MRRFATKAGNRAAAGAGAAAARAGLPVFRPAAASPAHQILWRSPAPRAVQRDVDPLRDPDRFDTVHQRLFVDAPTAAGAPLQPWTAGSAARIQGELKTSVMQEIEANPLRALGVLQQTTTRQDAEAAAIDADALLHARFPQIPTQLSQADIRSRVTVFASDFAPQDAPSADFVANWIDNQLPRRTAVEELAPDPADPDHRTLVANLAGDSALFPTAGILAAVRTLLQSQGWTPQDIATRVATVRGEIAGKSWAWLFNRMASRTAAFEGQGRVFVSESLPAARRRPTLVHEMVHAYAHADYRRWVAATTSQRLFNEGFTEILTRETLTPTELAARNSYQPAVDLIRQRILPFVPMDDLARAFFRGEAWRLEGRSAVSQSLFEAQVGIPANAARADEVTASQGGPGIVETVVDRSYYRFLNLGTDRATPKPEHEAFLRDVILPRVRAEAALRLRFVGHADSIGTEGQNLALARRRAAAFYLLAQRLGVPRAQLLDVARPPAGGETAPTAGNADVHGRAMNRRVELELTRP